MNQINIPPPVKRRTRIKISQPSIVCKNIAGSLENTGDRISEDSISPINLECIDNLDEKAVKHGNVDEIVVPEQGDATGPIMECPSATCPKPAPRMKIEKRVIEICADDYQKEEDAAKMHDVNEEVHNSPPNLAYPQPKPRKRKTPNSTVISDTTPDEIMRKETKKSKKRKFNASEVISSVLKREHKKEKEVPAKCENEKEEKAGDTGSPWDSPPPPQSLQKVYVQHKHGFSVHEWADIFKKVESKTDYPRNTCLTDVALCFHHLWTRLMVFSHGVLAGIACCHVLSVSAVLASTHNDVEQFVHFYHFLSLKVHFAVYVFTSLCIISCFDRLDIGDLTKTHLRDIGRSHGALLVTTAYLFCLIFSLTAHRHTAAIEEYKTNPTLWGPQGLQEWYWLVTTRDIVLLISWAFIAFSQQSDLLRVKLSKLGARAIHIELVSDLTANTFLMAFNRLMARRGTPKEIWSDQATTFQLSAKVLKQAQDTLATKGVTWKFICPNSAHQAGIWEAGIKSCKMILHAIIGKNVLTYEEMSTVLCRVEAVLNSRPLTELSSDPNDLEPLTPMHLVMGHPEEEITSVTPKQRWELVKQISRTFWTRWSSEYLTRLQQRPKWLTPQPNLRKGMLVLIKEEMKHPLKWKLGRIIDEKKTGDGLNRNFTVKTQFGVYDRPFNKLCMLPLADQDVEKPKPTSGT